MMWVFREFMCGSETTDKWAYQWNQSLPIFPECEVNIVFPIALAGFAVITFLPYIISLLVSKSKSSRLASCLYLCKLDLTFLCLILNAIRVLYIVSETRDYYIGSYIGSLSISVSLLLYIAVLHYERKRNSLNSAVCFFYLMLLNFVWICRCWNHTVFYIKHYSTITPISSTNITTTDYNTSTTLPAENSSNPVTWKRHQCLKKNKVILIDKHYPIFSVNYESAEIHEKDILKQSTDNQEETFKDENLELQKLQAKSPEKDCSFLSRITYAWFTRLIVKGFRKPLEFKDLWRLDSEHRSANLSKIFLANLDRHIVPKKTANSYLERRRTSMGNSVCDHNLESSENELRRKSAQSILGIGLPQYNKHLYKSGLTNNYVDETTTVRRASEGFYLLNKGSLDKSSSSLLNSNNCDVSNPDLLTLNNRLDHKVGSTHLTDIEVHSECEDPPVNAIKGHEKDASSRRSVRIRVGPKPEYIPELSESHSDSMIFTPANENSEFCMKKVGNETAPTNNNTVLKNDNQSVDQKISPSEFKTKSVRSSVEFDVSVKPQSKFKRFHFGFVNKRRFGLIGALFATYGRRLLWSAFLKLLYDILVFVNPILLKLLLKFLQNVQSEPIWHGYLYAIAIFIDTSVQSLILQCYFHVVFSLGMNIKTVITASVYRKSLRLSNKARYKSTTGQVMNLMSSDAQQFVQLMPFINILWSGPFQITISMVLLWRELGPAVLAGVAVLLLLLPINVLVARRSKFFQERKSANADSRIKLINELMSGIRVLKLYAWEPSFMKEISRIRNLEVKYLRKFTYLQSISFLWHCSPFLVAISSFGVYILTSEKNILDAQKAFVSLSLFNILRFPLFMFPMIISSLAQCHVSVGRLSKFLANEELGSESYSKEDTPGVAAVIERGVFGWDPEDEPTLTNISIQFPEGQLTTIMGSVGSGKSSLLHALLGDMENFNGRVNVKGTVAFVPQQPWIFNSTLRDNILFHRHYEPARYQKVLHACNLIPDLEMLPNGDLTEIGDKGINLSGGQKQRVSLARACYADADVYLLDDPLSAVDAHVGLHILTHVLSRSAGLLASKTCILTTHSPKALPFSDRVGLLVDGQLVELGNYRQLMHSQTSRLSAFLVTAIRAESENRPDSPKDIVDGSSVGQTEDVQKASNIFLNTDSQEPLSYLSVHSNPTSQLRHRTQSETHSIDRNSNIRFSNLTSTTMSQKSERSSIAVTEKKHVSEEEQKPEPHTGQLEKALTGRIKFQVFLTYFKNIGLFYGLLMLIFYPANHVTSLGGNLWLADWSNDAINYRKLTDRLLNASSWIGPINDSQYDSDIQQFYAQRNYRLSIYALLGFVQVLFAMCSLYTLAIGHLGCVVRLHSRLLSYVLHAPATFFDLVPHGRIVNKFSQDIATLDNPLMVTLNSTLNCALTCFLTLCIACTLNAFMIIPICLLTIIYLLIQNLYVTSSRQLKRLESISLSPIFSHFSETLSGVDSIRAYKLTETYKTISSTRQDLNNSAVYASMVSQRWLAVLLELVGNLVILAVAILSVSAQGYLSAGFSGLVITYALSLNQTLNWLVRMFSELETNIVCVERIHEYSSIEQEAPWELDCKYLPANWPEGRIEFVNYCTRYRPELDYALRSISFTVERGEKLGIVGRTGSGKSSLVLGLFRMLEAAEGEIRIDGFDISKLGLHDLRNRLTLIPQDPVLFSGTLRFNLDPFSHYSDDDIWKALELANLKPFIKEANNGYLGLDMIISEGGSNISLGQRQLVCLARALLRHTSILVLDEATAAVDMLTDSLIQETIRKEFSSCTVLTIAHRLNTVLDYDRVLVLEEGQVKELDSPKVLLQNKNSKFYTLAKDAHIVE
uniref:Multidrug resistance-associated protein 1 n=1 Tax=Trichobilharzia regenti TaxID=157069 RepID=A0AA85IZD0_TRIRE|nr:unnamed protein product [Trichobilharzia regenti]